MAFNKLYATTLLGNISDKATTFIGLHKEIREANPLLNAMINIIGMPTTIIIAFSVSWMMISYLNHKQQHKILMIATILYSLAALSNVITISKVLW